MRLLSVAVDGWKCAEHDDAAEYLIYLRTGQQVLLCADAKRHLRDLLGRSHGRRWTLTRKQYAALSAIAATPSRGLAGAEILAAMGSYATNSLKACLARELIRVSSDGRDLRTTIYELTAKGRELLEQLEGKP